MGQSGQEKTEQPTAKKRRDARKEGNIFQSRDVSTVVILAGIFFGIRIWLPFIYGQMKNYMTWVIDGAARSSEDMLSASLVFVTLSVFLKCALPLLLLALLLGIVAHGVQTRFNVSFKSIRPKWNRLNPLSGIKRLFSMKNVVELVKNSIKITLLLVLLYNILKQDLQPMASMIDMNPTASAAYMMKMIFDLLIRVCIAFTVIAFGDYLYQRWEYEKELRMTKQEVKDEYKNTEGDPQIKGRQRRKMQEVSQKRMMQDVPKADVVITNPTHFAVALKYEAKVSSAPVVLAKGEDYLAQKIKEVARENKIEIVENKPLARMLYHNVDVGAEIPPELYQAVAEVLAAVYKAKNIQ